MSGRDLVEPWLKDPARYVFDIFPQANGTHYWFLFVQIMAQRSFRLPSNNPSRILSRQHAILYRSPLLDRMLCVQYISKPLVVATVVDEGRDVDHANLI